MYICIIPPFCFAGEGVSLIVGGGAGDDFVAVLVDRPGRGGRQLALLLCLLFNFGNLLSLGARGGDLHTKDNVPRKNDNIYVHMFQIKRRKNN